MMAEALGVLMIGGTGFFGKATVRGLLRRGHAVTLFTRGKSQPEFWPQVDSIQGDREDHLLFRKLLEGREFDVVIDNIAYTGEEVKTAVEVLSGNIGHYILCSSGSVYQDYGDLRQWRLYHEDEVDLTFTGDNAYSEGKRGAELALWSIPQDSRPFPFTIIRPPVVEGPGDRSGRSWFWIQRIADGQPVLVPRTFPTPIFRNAYSEDVADAFVAAIANPRAFQKAYNVGSEELFSLEDYVVSIARAMGKEVAMADPPFEWVHSQPGLSTYNPPFAKERFVMDIGRAKEDLGFHPTPFPEWLKSTVEWFLEDYRGADSEDYDKRHAEVRAAEAWLST